MGGACVQVQSSTAGASVDSAPRLIDIESTSDMYSHFDGQYRSQPRVSLRGASKLEEKSTLLQRAHVEREQRENSRRRQTAAITIQACYRGHRVREKQYGLLRALFDGSPSANVLLLSQQLVLFYREDKDHARLIFLCQRWLQTKQLLLVEACSNSVCAFHLRHILVLCTASLHHSPNQTLAVPLRMLEVFLSPQSYTAQPNKASSKLLETLNAALVDNGYFAALRGVLETRVPPPDGPDSAHSALASSLLSYLTQPLLLPSGGEKYLSQFTRELFSDTLTPHMAHLLLPHLSSSSLPPSTIITTLHTVLLTNSLPPSPTLLYSLLQLVHNKLDSLSPSTVSQYCHLLAHILSRVSQNQTTNKWVEPDDDDEELVNEWVGLEEAEFDPLDSPKELLACCLSIIILNKNLPLYLQTQKSYPSPLLHGLCALCHQLLMVRWTGISPAVFFQQLAISPSLLLPLWKSVASVNLEGFSQTVPGLQYLSRGGQLPSREGAALVEHLGTFSSLLTLYLSSLHDAEFYGEMTTTSYLPFSHPELVSMVTVLRDVYVSLHMEKHLPHGYSAARLTRSPLSSRTVELKPSPAEYQQMKKCVYQLLCSLHERNSRRPFCPPRHWEMPHLNKITAPADLFLETDEDEQTVPHVAPSVMKSAELLRRAPFIFPFEERVRFFRSLVMESKRSIRGHLQEFLIGPSLQVTARRNHIYEDAFSDLSQGKDLRLSLKVTLVNAQGLNEPGIDGGGVFREFLSELLKTGFDPNHGYFTTTQEGQLYPNPQAPFLSDNYVAHYRFLGAMLGKALYEHLLVEIPFAGFFLCKLTDRGQGKLEAYHLASLDPELYRNLLSLKHYEGDVEDLDLNFTTISSEFGQSKVVELRSGGGDIPVTRDNCVQYIHLLAHWRLNVSIERQFRAFREGLASVVPLQWLRLFNQGELQVLISGAEVPIDINDLRANTKYAGEYKEDHEGIHMFWKVVEGFTEQEKQQLLKFVTSCSRPPLLGFKDLFPPFCVMSGGQDDRLPSASTCMNLLKLPIFPDIQTLQNRLKYALSSGAGFELS